MALWRHTLDIKELWDEEQGDLIDQAWLVRLCKAIKDSSFYDKDDLELDELMEGLAGCTEPDDFNYFWNQFYDYCDIRRIWVRTF